MGKKVKQDIMVDAVDIMEVLPHRYPMLLIDAVLECEAGAYAVAKKAFTYNEPYFQGHYPQKPIVPGTFLLEGLSQTATYALLSGVGGGILLFTGVSKMRLFRSVFPGDSIIYRAAVESNRYGLWTVSGEGKTDSGVCIRAEMNFVRDP